MCGLVAIIRSSGLQDHERAQTIDRMRDAIAHRGPDDATSLVVQDWAALGFRRLSIIDLAGSRQPLSNETESVHVVFNGEIYNFQELRLRLEALGHTFRTHGDGEVIVHGYEQWGDEIAGMLEGMFAFVLVDAERQRMVAGRDRLGIKPLFWTETGGAVLMGSEIKALLEHPAVARTANADALALGALRMHVPWPLTAFAGIYRLPPGTVYTRQRGAEPKWHRYAPMIAGGRGRSKRSPGDVVEECRLALERAVARQMVADVPVGAFLSGGIDSTLIVALMSRVAKAPVHTFSVRVGRDDESKVAEATAARLGTVHTTVHLDDLSFDALTDLPGMFDEPFAETSAIGVKALSVAARREVKVALSGDGGDEVFGGYDTYRWIRATCRRNGRDRRSLVGRASAQSRSLLSGHAWPSTIRRALRAVGLMGLGPAEAQRALTSFWWDLDPDLRAMSEALSDRVARNAGSHLESLSVGRLAMASDRLERLANAMLTKVDIASMAASLEVRVPLLDDVLVRFADDLSDRDLFRMGRGKIVLRRVLHDLQPNGLAWAPKRGFSLPLDMWLRQEPTRTRFEQLVLGNRETITELTGFDVAAAWRSFDDGQTRASDGTSAMRLLWFATVALWSQRFGVRDSVSVDIGECAIA